MIVTFNELKSLVGDLIAKQIIMEYFSFSLLEYSLARSNTISENDRKNLINIANLYLNNMPLQYIFKKTYIKDLEFLCENGVLIPRCDTEILIDLAINYIKEHNIKNAYEIGFGSGIISICLKLFTNINIKACDINKKALELACKNAKKHNVDCDFHLADFNSLSFKNYELVVSNPPYISTDYALDEYVKKEPKTALYGGKKGYELLFKIIKKCYLENVKCLICEFGYDQKEVLREYLKEHNFKASFYKDLNGFDRVFIAERLDYEKN